VTDGTDQLLTRTEAAHLLRVRSSTLAQWSWRGRGPRFFKPDGGRCLYRMSDLNAWLASGEIVPGVVGMPQAIHQQGPT
jgi:hypothetical protein